ncbi:MAG: FHA domain-containing serine/threonine-protein kinase [Odoribacter sp.]|nr:FHA domain-containing serine/threonine-protein kinase [Odoribacter sp.]
MASPIVNIEKVRVQPGDIIAGRYTIERSLGEGSFGNVFLTTGADGSQYAIKLLRLWEVNPEIRNQLVQRFDMEYETGRINSPFLVHSIDHGFLGGNPFIVMEFCPGGDLIHLASRGGLDHAKVALDVLGGLRSLHSAGKVHRDLKPENVLLKADGTFALTDFGISGDRNKRMTERNFMGRPKQIFGTYAYMPPEQVKPVRDATVLPTTDIFSFGVMMYQLLCGGKLPFGVLEGERDLVPYLERGRLGNWDRTPLMSMPDGQQWLRLLEGCLNPDFQKRIQSAGDAINIVPRTATTRNHATSDADRSDDFCRKITNGVLLRVMQGEEYGRIYRLDDMLKGDCAVITLGRRDPSVHNDIDIKETQSVYLSRRHCTFELDYAQGQWVVRDGQWVMNTGGSRWQRSTNGTFVNSSEVSTEGMVVTPGDIISVGDVKLRAEGY